MDLETRIAGILAARRERGEFRTLPEKLPGVDFTSNDYLGLSRSAWIHDRVIGSLSEGHKPSGATGSRLLSGNSAEVLALELRLADFLRAEAALVLNSGYAANTGLIATVCRPGDLVFYDRHVHASMHEGMKLSRADCTPFGHNDLAGLEAQLRIHAGRPVFVLTESVFSMDGDHAPLRALGALQAQYGFHLIVDEAHAVGIYGEQGRGLCVEQGMEHHCLARVVTFGKALGAHGAAIAGPAYLRDYLVNFCKPFIYSTALDRASLLAVEHGLNYLLRFKYQRYRLIHLINKFKTMSANLSSFSWVGDGPVFGLLAGSAPRCRRLAAHLNQAGFDVRPIVYPTVARGGERLRISLHSFNTEEELEHFFEALKTFVE